MALDNITQSSRRALLVGAAGVLVAVLVAASTVLGASSNGKAVTAVRTVHGITTTLATTSTTAVDVPGYSTAIGVPSGERAVLIITFSAFAYCVDASADASNVCLIRVLVDDVEASPGEVWWDTAGDGPGGDTHSMQWIASVGTGHHVVRVQYFVSQADGTVELKQAVLTVLRSRVP